MRLLNASLIAAAAFLLNTVTAQCDGTWLELTAEAAPGPSNRMLSAPGWFTNAGYSPNLDCYWRFVSDNDARPIWLELSAIAMQSSAGCSADYVKIYDGYNLSASLRRTFCGYDTVSGMEMSGKYAVLHFHTDADNNGETFLGFQMHYKNITPGQYDNDITPIIGGAVGVGVLLIAAIVITVIYVCKRLKQKKPAVEPEQNRNRPATQNGASTNSQPPIAMQNTPVNPPPRSTKLPEPAPKGIAQPQPKPQPQTHPSKPPASNKQQPKPPPVTQQPHVPPAAPSIQPNQTPPLPQSAQLQPPPPQYQFPFTPAGPNYPPPQMYPQGPPVMEMYPPGPPEARMYPPPQAQYPPPHRGNLLPPIPHPVQTPQVLPNAPGPEFGHAEYPPPSYDSIFRPGQA